MLVHERVEHTVLINKCIQHSEEHFMLLKMFDYHSHISRGQFLSEYFWKRTKI